MGCTYDVRKLKVKPVEPITTCPECGEKLVAGFAHPAEPLPGQVDMFGKVVDGEDVDSYV